MTVAFVFPGQGAQAIGMGRDLAQAYPAARAVFDEVDEALGEKLSDLIWEGDQDTLTLTQNAQPALMATSLAAMRALEAEGVSMDKAAFVAGHSLGEYSALAAAGAISVADTARLLRTRGRAMQQAVPVGVGAMAALLGLDFAAATQVAAEAAGDEVCQAANDNDPGQVVISGHKAAVERACEIAKTKGAKRAVLLPVSSPVPLHLDGPCGPSDGPGPGRGDNQRPKRAFGRQCARPSGDICQRNSRIAGAASDRLCAVARKRGLDGRSRCE